MEDILKTQCPPKDSLNTLFSMALDVPTFQAQQADERNIMMKLYKNRLKTFEELNNTFTLDPEYTYPSDPTYPIHVREKNNLRLLGLEDKTSTIVGDLIAPLPELFGEQLKEEDYLHSISTKYNKNQFGVDGLFGELVINGHTAAKMPRHIQPLPPLATSLYLPKRNAGLEFKKLTECLLTDSGEPQKLTPREYYIKLVTYIEKLQEKIQKDIAFIKQKGSKLDVDTLENKKSILKDEKDTNILNFFEDNIESNTLISLIKQFAANKDISIIDQVNKSIRDMFNIPYEEIDEDDFEDDYEEYFNYGIDALYEAERYKKIIEEENENAKVKREAPVLAVKKTGMNIREYCRRFNKPLEQRMSTPQGGGSRKNKKIKNSRLTRRNGRS